MGCAARVGWLLAPLAALSLSACETWDATPATPDRLARFFEEVAFWGSPGGYPMSETAKSADPNYDNHFLVRWEKDIRIKIEGEKSATYRGRVEIVAQRLGSIVGRKVAFLSASDGGENFLVRFMTGRTLASGFESVPCVARPQFQAKAFSRVSIEIGIDREDLVEHCIAHELLHGFGFAHSQALPSAINGMTPVREPTRFDEMALRALYDPRLKSGMSRREASPIAREILVELSATPSSGPGR